MLTCQNLSCAIQGKPIIDELSFSLEGEKHLLILGPSGCGKTTLLSLLAGIQKPDAGEVVYDGVSLYGMSETERDLFRGRELGILFQTFHLIKVLNVRQNLLVAASMAGKKLADDRVYKVLDRLGLVSKAQQNVTQLSVGEAQRLAVARAVIAEPRWILCDEPTSALDDDNAEKMLILLAEEAANCKASLVVVTHDKRVTRFFDNQQILHLGGEG